MFSFRVRFLLAVLMMSWFQSALYAMDFYRGFERVIAYVAKPTHTPVFMNHSDIIQMDGLVDKESIISTGGLVGCTATVLYVKNEHNQLQKAVLTHYSNGDSEHGIDLKQRIDQLHEMHPLLPRSYISSLGHESCAYRKTFQNGAQEPGSWAPLEKEAFPQGELQRDLNHQS